MTRVLLTICAALVLVPSAAAASQPRKVPPFTGIELRGSNNVSVRAGLAQSVVVHGDAAVLSRVTTRVEGSTLVIGNRPGSYTSKTPMTVEVTVPAIRRIVLSGSGNLTATGTARSLDVALSGSGNLQMGRLTTRDVHAVLSGSGTIHVTATKSLDAALSGSGVIAYGGSPSKVRTSVTGSGVVVRS